ncbi:MAG: hypothetical protein ACTSUA_04420 [Candidatus Heimdallarchaeota archaeon]
MTTEKQKEGDSKPREKKKRKIDVLLTALEEQDNEPFTLPDLNLELNKYKGLLKRMIAQEILKQAAAPDSSQLQKEENIHYQFISKKAKEFRENEMKRLFTILVATIIPGVLFLLLGIVWIILFI